MVLFPWCFESSDITRRIHAVSPPPSLKRGRGNHATSQSAGSRNLAHGKERELVVEGSHSQHNNFYITSPPPTSKSPKKGGGTITRFTTPVTAPRGGRAFENVMAKALSTTEKIEKNTHEKT